MPRNSNQVQNETIEQVAEVAVVEQTVEEVEESFSTLYQSMVERVNDAYNTLRTCRADLKLLERHHRREMKNSRKWRRNRDSSRGQKKPSGFNKPSLVPEAIVELLGLESGVELPRTQVTKLIYGYIKEHNLQVPEDKRTINPNAALIELFGLAADEQISFYNIQTHIKKLYPSKTEVVEEAAEEEVVEEVAAPVKKTKRTKKRKRRAKNASTTA